MKEILYMYVRKQLFAAHGAQVIVNQIADLYDNVRIVHDKKDIPAGVKVVPYGVLESFELIKMRNRNNLGLSLLIDAFSLGEISKLRWFWDKPYLPLKHRIKCILKYFKYMIYEWYILKYYKHIMLVSWGDKKYYERNILTRKNASKICVIPNGVTPQSGRPDYQRKKDDELIIGCLSPWNETLFATLMLFLTDIWEKLPTRQGLRLIVAGRYLTKDRMEALSHFENVTIMGEVGDLSEFYDAIDVTLLTMVKKCGIINRLLDGFAYQVPVLTRPESLLAFKEQPACCFIYNDVKSFQKAIEDITEHPENVRAKISEAMQYIEKEHNWEYNYKHFAELLD